MDYRCNKLQRLLGISLARLAIQSYNGKVRCRGLVLFSANIVFPHVLILSVRDVIPVTYRAEVDSTRSVCGKNKKSASSLYPISLVKIKKCLLLILYPLAG